MSGPSSLRVAFDFAAASRRACRSRLPTAGNSRSMMYLRMILLHVRLPPMVADQAEPGKCGIASRNSQVEGRPGDCGAPQFRNQTAEEIADAAWRRLLLRRRFRRRNDAGHDIRAALETGGNPRRDLGLPVVAVVDRLVQRLALGFALEATHPDIGGIIGLAAIAAGDDHAFRYLEGDDLLFHDLNPLIHLARQNLVLAQFVKGHFAGLRLFVSYG